VICGDGVLRDELERYCREEGLKVTFKGFIQDPSDYLVRCQYGFVSGYLSILEAMASQCLVFSVYKNKIKEDYLKLMPDGDKMMIIAADPNRLAEYLKRAWEGEATFREHKNRASAFAQDQSWEKLAKIYRELWGT
jgi:glycosyltransferase involved in cell wall biosynthesis